MSDDQQPFILFDGPRPLVLYTLVARDEVDECVRRNVLPIAEGWWYIGFRQRAQDAVDRARQVGLVASKSSHLIPEVTFSPLGVAHYATTCEGASQYYTPVLHKVVHKWVSDDKCIWHSHRDLPLSLGDSSGNPLVSTQWLEIV